jgi:hypothetical protein
MYTKQVESIIRNAAKLHNLDEAALLAIIETESSGEVFWNVDGKLLPAIRWEGHYFYKRLTGDKLAQAVKEGLASPKAGRVPNPRSYAARYALLAKARAIDVDAANESVSWGMGQVMGANWQLLGYPNVGALVKAAETPEGQVDMMVRFLRANNLFASIRAKDWATVARVYNGKGYRKNKYDEKIGEAYTRWVVGRRANTTADVKQVQTMLNSVGDYKLVVDGDMGESTILAIRDFQLKRDLVVDGKYGPITREYLEAAYRAKANSADVAAGTATGGIGAAGTVLTEVAKQIEPISKGSMILQFVFVGLILLGAFLTIKPMIWKR